MSLEVIVTSGGTIAPIDDVRCIANFSMGTTGARIAEEFLRQGAKVHYVHAKRAERPWRRALSVDSSRHLDSELARITAAYEECQLHKFRLHEYQFETFEEYHTLVQRLVLETPADAIILAAAVSDYSCERGQGKIASDHDELALRLHKNPKIISLVKSWNKHIFQVGFKLLADVTFEQMVDAAYKHGIANHSDLTVANALNADMRQRMIAIITPEKGITPVRCDDLASTLVQSVSQRVSHTHYATQLSVDTAHSTIVEKSATFRSTVQGLYQYNVFEPYYKGASMHFGFVAQRVPDGFLITARGSDKEHCLDADITFVSKTDFAQRQMQVISSGKKASLNANVAAQVFAGRPDVNLVVHAHVFPGVANVSCVDYAPGTDEDREQAWLLLRSEKIAELKNHGIIALGNTVEDIVALLSKNQAYTQFAEYYDVIYHRFSHTPDLVEMVSRNVQREEKVLDLAGGTGSVAAALRAVGYNNVSLADKSEAMLAAAQKKLPGIRMFTGDMANLELDTAFDAIVVRQAINYLLDYEGLVCGLRGIRRHLLPGGRLFFNAPNCMDTSARDLEYDAHGYHVTLSEMNVLEGRLLTHTQRCTLRSLDCTKMVKLYDLNTFGVLSKDEFSAALQDAGYGEIAFFGKHGKYTPDTHSLYCVARR